VRALKASLRGFAERDNRKVRVTPLLLILGLGFLVRLSLAWVSTPTLIQKTIPDDAFYYFGIARHMAMDGTPSINGLNVTNGFHPLWLLLIGPFFYALPHHLDLPIHLTLVMGAALDTVSAFLAYKLVRLLTGNPSAALTSALVYAMNPRSIFYAVSGMETALNVCMFALFVFAWTAVRVKGPTLRRYAFLGVIGGLLLLARTDNVFLFLVVHSLTAWAALRGPGTRGVIASHALTILLLAPWLLWSYGTFGTIMQSSGIALPFALRGAYALSPQASTMGMLLTPIHLYLGRDALLIDASWTGLPPLVGLPLWIAVTVAGAKIMTDVSKRHRSLGGLSIASAAALAFALLLVFHIVVRWYPRPWYFAPLSWVFATTVGMLIDASAPRPSGLLWRHRKLVGLVLSEIFLMVGAFWWLRGLYPQHNSGLHAYYSDRVVVNLDGVVNGDALKAIQEKQLLDYMHSMGITYLADYNSAIVATFAPFYGEEPLLQLVHTVECEGVAWEDSGVQVYRLLE
jgi:hypothetical protein